MVSLIDMRFKSLKKGNHLFGYVGLRRRREIQRRQRKWSKRQRRDRVNQTKRETPRLSQKMG